MNVAFFLKPKGTVTYLYDDCTFRQALEKMRVHGYTDIPVIDRDGKYRGSLSEGDILWYLVLDDGDISVVTMKKTSDLYVSDILNTKKNPAVRITCSIDELIQRAMNQNYVPVVDDMNNFIGIVTRRDIIKHYAEEKDGEADQEL